MLKSNTVFKFAAVHPCESQFLTCGTDRKLGYYASNELDASLVRVIEGSQSGSINGLDISPDGAVVVTGGEDQLIKVTISGFFVNVAVSNRVATQLGNQGIRVKVRGKNCDEKVREIHEKLSKSGKSQGKKKLFCKCF